MPTFTDTAQKMRFSIKDFFRKLRIRSHLLKKLLMENFILYAVWSNPQEKISFFDKWKYLTLDTFKILFEDVGAIEQNFLFLLCEKCTHSKFLLVCIFPHLVWSRDLQSNVSYSEYGKIQTRKSSNFRHFSRSVKFLIHYNQKVYIKLRAAIEKDRQYNYQACTHQQCRSCSNIHHYGIKRSLRLAYLQLAQLRILMIPLGMN